MKKFLLIVITLGLIAVINTDCHKSNGGGGSNEVALVVQLTPAEGSTQPPAPGPDFPFKLEITSTIPPGGVKITVTVAPDGTSNYFYNQTIASTTQAVTNLTITGTPNNVICVVQVTVTSLSSSTNKWTGSYRYSSK